MNIFVAKLSSKTSDDSLRVAFEAYGNVSSAKVIRDRETGYSKKFGFVEMPDDENANQAIKEMNESDLEGSIIAVKKARPREDRDNRNFRRF